MAQKVEACDQKVTELQNYVQRLEQRIDSLEDRGRRNNLVIFGVHEEDNENTKDLNQSVVERVFLDRLGVAVNTVERIHRTGQKNKERNRPFIVKFYDFSEKIKILTNCSKLKGSSLSISEDFSYSTRQIRKCLWESAKENRINKDKVSLVYNKLKINDDWYVWNETENQRVKCDRVHTSRPDVQDTSASA